MLRGTLPRSSAVLCASRVSGAFFRAVPRFSADLPGAARRCAFSGRSLRHPLRTRSSGRPESPLAERPGEAVSRNASCGRSSELPLRRPSPRLLSHSAGAALQARSDALWRPFRTCSEAATKPACDQALFRRCKDRKSFRTANRPTSNFLFFGGPFFARSALIPFPLPVVKGPSASARCAAGGRLFRSVPFLRCAAAASCRLPRGRFGSLALLPASLCRTSAAPPRFSIPSPPAPHRARPVAEKGARDAPFVHSAENYRFAQIVRSLYIVKVFKNFEKFFRKCLQVPKKSLPLHPRLRNSACSFKSRGSPIGSPLPMKRPACSPECEVLKKSCGKVCGFENPAYLCSRV